MIWENESKNLELVGLPIEELEINTEDRQLGHYLLDKLDMNQFKVLDKNFDSGVLREIVDDTKTDVICRFIYDDEDEKEVKKSWIKIIK